MTKSKISVSLTDEAAQAIDELAEKKGIPVSEVVRRAIALERFVQGELEQGNSLMIRRPNGDLERIQLVFG